MSIYSEVVDLLLMQAPVVGSQGIPGGQCSHPGVTVGGISGKEVKL